MHRILKSHLNSFVSDYGLESDEDSVKFEKFCNFAFIQPKVSSRIDLDDITTDLDDDGIDGVAIIINEELISGEEDANVIFTPSKRNNDVEVIFIQAKRSESYDLGDFLKFKEAVIRFISQDPYEALNNVQKEARKAFDIVINNVAKIRGGKPKLTLLYVTSGIYQSPRPQESAKEDAIAQIGDFGYFSDINIEFLGREDLISAWVNSYSGIEVNLQMYSHAGLPQISGIQESYLAVIKARDFVNKVLSSEDGSIRSQLFEDNVRHYLGDENPVNASIKSTIVAGEKSTRFPVLNNGVTIVSPDVVVQTNRIYIKNFQIVNGCQTSHVLFENRDEISEEMMITLKVVETEDENVFADLVRATNSQSQVHEKQFYSLSPIARKIEQYFNTFEGQEGRLYFERRVRQYSGKGIPALRIIDLDTVARAFSSLFLRRPDLAFRYPKYMYEQLSDKIFSENNKEELYYACSLLIYRIHVLNSNATIPNTVRKYKWHILPIVGALVAGKEIPPLHTKKASQYAQKIIDNFQTQSSTVTDIFVKADKIMQDLPDLTNDRLKRQAILSELLYKVS